MSQVKKQRKPKQEPKPEKALNDTKTTLNADWFIENFEPKRSNSNKQM